MNTNNSSTPDQDKSEKENRKSENLPWTHILTAALLISTFFLKAPGTPVLPHLLLLVLIYFPIWMGLSVIGMFLGLRFSSIYEGAKERDPSMILFGLILIIALMAWCSSPNP